ncbi:MAG: hypothetical protein ACF8PN_08780 [Phycisphaerales bacterium]
MRLNTVHRNQVHRRGVAAMIVIVAVATVTVVTMAFLHAQDTAPDTSGNVAKAVKARFIAETGADLTEAIMQCETLDWRSAHTDGYILQDYDFGGGKITIKVTNPDGSVPDENSELVILSAEGDIDELEQTAKAIAFAPKNPGGGADIDLSEFAIFGTDYVTVQGEAWLRSWPASPQANTGGRLRIGTNATGSSKVEFVNDGSTPGADVHVQQIASSSIIKNTNRSRATVNRINTTIDEPFPVPGIPSFDFSSLVWADYRNPVVTSGGDLTFDYDRRYESVEVRNTNHRSTNIGHRTIVIDGKLKLDTATWTIIGETDLIVLGDLQMTNAALVFPEGSRARIWVGGNITLYSSAIGVVDRSLRNRDEIETNTANYRDPDEVQIFKVSYVQSNGDGNVLTADVFNFNDFSVKSWTVTNDSVVCGRLYGLDRADITIDGESALFGAALGRQVKVAGSSWLCYDHALDQRAGYTNPDSKLFVGEMDLDDRLYSAADDLNESTQNSVKTMLGASTELVDPNSVADGDPTPRRLDRARITRWTRLGGARPSGDDDDDDD